MITFCTIPFQVLFRFVFSRNMIQVLYATISLNFLNNVTWRSFPCFFLSCKANARVKPAKTGHGPHSSYFCIVVCIVCFVSFSVLFVCICVLYYCHRVATKLQLNISYHIFVRTTKGTFCIKWWIFTALYTIGFKSPAWFAANTTNNNWKQTGFFTLWFLLHCITRNRSHITIVASFLSHSFQRHSAQSP